MSNDNFSMGVLIFPYLVCISSIVQNADCRLNIHDVWVGVAVCENQVWRPDLLQKMCLVEKNIPECLNVRYFKIFKE